MGQCKDCKFWKPIECTRMGTCSRLLIERDRTRYQLFSCEPGGTETLDVFGCICFEKCSLGRLKIGNYIFEVHIHPEFRDSDIEFRDGAGNVIEFLEA